MQIYHDIRTTRLPGPTVLTIGNYDGVHRGHQAILQRMHQFAAEYEAWHPASQRPATVLLTFHPHPLALLRPQVSLRLLTTPAERLQLVAAAQIDVTILHPFDRATADLSAQLFMAILKEQIGLVALVTGPDFALGRNRAGNLELLTALGRMLDYEVIVLPPFDWQGQPVRSRHVRELLEAGNVADVARLLNRPYTVTGIVEAGDRRGRLIGVPTANLRLDPLKLLPADGVYATRTWLGPVGVGSACSSVTNLGVRPTVDGLHHKVETHLLDFPPAGQVGDLYGQELTVEFIARLRAERRFSGIDELVAQIRVDIAAGRAVLEHVSDHEKVARP